MKALVLSSSPRRDGNSALLAEAVSQGLKEAGHEIQFVFADDFLIGFLRDCRKCRMPNGECSIEDGFRSVFLDHYLSADGFIAASPIYWYGISAQLKAFFDRTFCYYAASYPQSDKVIEGMKGKRIGLVLSSEETFPMVSGQSSLRSRNSPGTPVPSSSASFTATATPAEMSAAIPTIRSLPRGVSARRFSQGM